MKSIFKNLIISGLCSLFLVSVDSSAASLEIHESLSQKFYRRVKLSATQRAPIANIIYGNDAYGYYSTKVFKRNKTNLYLRFVPPGYKEALDFYIGYKKGSKVVYAKVATKKFRSPVPKAYQNQTGEIVMGKFTSPFFLLSGGLPKQKLINPNFKTDNSEIYKKDKYRYTFVQILNRLGEIVWLHVPTYKNAIMSSYLQAKPVGPGEYGILFGKKAGFYQSVDYAGKITHEFSSRFDAEPFTMHHDFTVVDKDRIVTVSTKTSDLKNSRLKDQKGQIFLSDVLVEINLADKKKTEYLDFLTHFNPATASFWSGDQKDDKKFALWGEPKADFEFTHVNALEYYRGKGFLVSIRNLNKIVMFDTKLKKVLWTLGSDKNDTFAITNEEDQFLHQHTPQLLDNGNVMLFNNGRTDKSSKIMLFELDKIKNEAKLIWSFEPSPKLYSKNRSSSSYLANGNTLAYYVSPIIGNAKATPKPNIDHLMEIDKNGKQVAYMKRYFQVLSPGYRAVPMETVGQEEYVGQTFAEAKRKAAR